jgi:hypothetical protein
LRQIVPVFTMISLAVTGFCGDGGNTVSLNQYRLDPASWLIDLLKSFNAMISMDC